MCLAPFVLESGCPSKQDEFSPVAYLQCKQAFDLQSSYQARLVFLISSPNSVHCSGSTPGSWSGAAPPSLGKNGRTRTLGTVPLPKTPPATTDTKAPQSGGVPDPAETDAESEPKAEPSMDTDDDPYMPAFTMDFRPLVPASKYTRGN